MGRWNGFTELLTIFSVFNDTLAETFSLNVTASESGTAALLNATDVTTGPSAEVNEAVVSPPAVWPWESTDHRAMNGQAIAPIRQGIIKRGSFPACYPGFAVAGGIGKRYGDRCRPQLFDEVHGTAPATPAA